MSPLISLLGAGPRGRCLSIFLFLLLLTGGLAGAESTNAPIFKDKNLEAAVRKFVLEKRDNDKPLTEADLLNLSTIQGDGMQITDLSGLEKCPSLASLSLARNKISDLTPLRNLARLQYLHLAHNQIEKLDPLSTVTALQYLELSMNKVRNLQPLSPLTNLNSLYLATNQISDIGPVLKLPRLWSLYLDHNAVKSIQGISGLKSLSTLGLNNNQVIELSPLNGLNSLSYLFLENNRIKDLAPLVAMVKKDNEGEKRFATFINIYLTGNQLSSTAKKSQLPALKSFGSRVHY